MSVSAPQSLRGLGERFFDAMHRADPFSASVLGLREFDSLVPDLSNQAQGAWSQELRRLEQELEGVTPGGLGPAERTDREVLHCLLRSTRSQMEHALWTANASAAAYASPQGNLFLALAATRLHDRRGLDRHLERLAGLGAFFDAMAARYRQAQAEGRSSTRVGVRQAVDQLRRHSGEELDQDQMVLPELGPELEPDQVRRETRPLVEQVVRPAMERLLHTLEQELLPRARPDERVGLSFVPGGEEAYRDAVRQHTTTELSPHAIHQLGLDCLAELEAEWADLGLRTLGTSDPAQARRRLLNDRTLRFRSSSEILAVVQGALERAEAARDRWFPSYRIPQCVVEEISPLEVNNAALAYYRPPAADGSRPGAHCVLTAHPEQRLRHEYEALAFHESTPGHHLQLASAQTLDVLPRYRRHLDAQLCAYIEGWGLYSERLADEMGLYTSDLSRLGMLSFDALRACRLVVDTGMHQLGWSRQRAIDFMAAKTATPPANVRNEVDRYIAWPGQALAYMVGCREIRRLRHMAEDRLGGAFSVSAFHGTVLGQGPVPLFVLETIVSDWIGAGGATLRQDQQGDNR